MSCYEGKIENFSMMHCFVSYFSETYYYKATYPYKYHFFPVPSVWRFVSFSNVS